MRRRYTTPKKLTKSTAKRRDDTQTLRSRSKAGAKWMIVPTKEGALAAWKQISNIVISRTIAMQASTDLPIMKETVQITAKAQENTLVIDPEAEKEQNKTGIGITIPKEREPGAGKDTTKMKQGDGKNADITRIVTLFMEQEIVERGSPLILIKTLTN